MRLQLGVVARAGGQVEAVDQVSSSGSETTQPTRDGEDLATSHVRRPEHGRRADAAQEATRRRRQRERSCALGRSGRDHVSLCGRAKSSQSHVTCRASPLSLLGPPSTQQQR